jgi:hypothetical protein
MFFSQLPTGCKYSPHPRPGDDNTIVGGVQIQGRGISGKVGGLQGADKFFSVIFVPSVLKVFRDLTQRTWSEDTESAEKI